MSNNNSLKVLLAGAECAPFVKLGGLADVMGTLPKELNQICLLYTSDAADE